MKAIGVVVKERAASVRPMTFSRRSETSLYSPTEKGP